MLCSLRYRIGEAVDNFKCRLGVKETRCMLKRHFRLPMADAQAERYNSCHGETEQYSVGQ